ncbi:hypothetical protein [Parashewanella tropica]|uniref:hypothetical protein n=1 Tax=Parashewanella tropica TaxID=2547970 RepID=UPI00105978F0|nr:hypothetical protein [Parashewanella tropica]
MSTPPVGTQPILAFRGTYLTEDGKANTGNKFANFLLNHGIGVKEGTIAGWFVAKRIGQATLDQYRDELSSRAKAATAILNESGHDIPNDGVEEEADIMRSESVSSQSGAKETTGSKEVTHSALSYGEQAIEQLNMLSAATQDAIDHKLPQPTHQDEHTSHVDDAPNDSESVEDSFEESVIPASQIPFRKPELSEEGQKFKKLHEEAQLAITEYNTKIEQLHLKIEALKLEKTEKNEQRNKLTLSKTRPEQSISPLDIETKIAQLKQEESELAEKIEDVVVQIGAHESGLEVLKAEEQKAYKQYLLRGGDETEFNQAYKKAVDARPKPTKK